MEVESISKLQWRYAVKKFDSERLLPDAKINILKEAFNLTATSYGLQPIKLVILNNKELQAKLAKSSFGQQQVADASHVLVFCVETNIDANFITDYFSLVKKIRNTADTILHPFRDSLITSFGKKNEEEIIVWATKQAYLALGNLLTICAFEEIDACPMEGFIPNEYDELLQLREKKLKSVLVLPVGYRHQDDFFATQAKVRKHIKDSIIEL